MIRRITIAVLAAFLAGAVLAVPASSKSGPAKVAKKKAKKCKKGKKGKKAKKRKGCKRGSSSVVGLPGEATPASPKQPNKPPPPPDNPVLHVESVALTVGTVFGGNSTSGQVTLDQAAPAGGQQVDLTSNSGRATLPASVVVVSGETSASFQVATTSGPPVTATVTASIGTSNATAVLKVVDRPSVTSVELQKQCLTPGTWPTNRVTLDIPAPNNTIVALSSNTASLGLPLPTVTVPSGSTSALFSVSVDPLAAPAEATVSATAPSTPAQSDSAQVNPTDPPKAADLQLNPSTVVPGQSSSGTVTLDCEAPPDGTEVTLSSSDPAVDVQGPVTIEEDELSVDFPITVTGIPEGGSATITAEAGGVPQTALLIVSQPD